MKKPIVFYFHGLNSSPTTGKVSRLKEHFPNTYAFPIDVDPDISVPFLEGKIEDTLIDHLHEEISIFFVGTSLGGWYAAKLAEKFFAHSVLINPAYFPHMQLPSLGVKKKIADKYGFISLKMQNQKIFIGTEDTIIDFSAINFILKAFNVTYVYGADHMFNGPEFDMVIEHIKNNV